MGFLYSSTVHNRHLTLNESEGGSNSSSCVISDISIYQRLLSSSDQIKQLPDKMKYLTILYQSNLKAYTIKLLIY